MMGHPPSTLLFLIVRLAPAVASREAMLAAATSFSKKRRFITAAQLGAGAGAQQYVVGAHAEAADPIWTVATGGSWIVDPDGRGVPLTVAASAPPPGFSPSQLHRDWIAFQCAVNARYIEA